MGEKAEKRLGWLILAAAAAAIIGLAVTMSVLNSRPQLAESTAQRTAPVAAAVAHRSSSLALDRAGD